MLNLRKTVRFSAWTTRLFLLAMVGLAACSDSDEDYQGDRDEITDNPPQQTEEEDRCQEGFVYQGGKCVPELNTDEDRGVADQDSDLEPDEVDVEPGETPYAHLLGCPSNDGPFPCLVNLPFEYTNDKGEFRFGSPAGLFQNGIDVWENWIVFHWNRKDYKEFHGLFLFDYLTKTFILLSDYSLWPGIGCNQIVWVDYDKNLAAENNGKLFQSDLSRIEKKSLSQTISYKKSPKITPNRVFWIDNREFGTEYNYNLYTFNEFHEEVKVDSIGNGGIDRYAVYGNKVAYAMYPDRSLVLVDYDTNIQKLISQDAVADFRVVMSEKYIFWNSLRYAENTDCGYSILKYDLETGEETIFKQSTGLDDWLVWDIWEDWLVYTDYSKGGGAEGFERCRYTDADGDLILHYLPTGEEWNLTDEHGPQEQAAMWGPLIVWKDSRHDLSPPWRLSNVFGVDLCMHPELKSRFEACAKR